MLNMKKLIISNHQVIISVIITTIIGVFYFNQKIYILISHNDFFEYFHRAEHWAEGNLLWEYGSDKLLSVIEYIAIKISDKSNFINIYDNINNLIITLTLISIYLFLTTKNNLSIPFLVKALGVLFFCSLPYVIINANTVDQTYLFGIMLLMWLAVYHISIISAIIAFLVTLARPEGVIIIPLFIFILWLDNNNRKKLIVNFGLFLLFLIAYKIFDSFYMPHSYGETEMLEKSYEKYISTNIVGLVQFFISLILLPVNYFILALITLKSYIYFIFFTIGTLVSLKEKKYYPYLAIPTLYLIMLLILSKGQHSHYDLYNIVTYISSKVSLVTPYNFIYHYSNDYQTLFYGLLDAHLAKFPIAAQGRYALFLYPFISIFVVVGVVFVVEKIFFLIKNYKLKQYGSLLTIVIILGLFLVSNTFQYLAIKNKFHLETPTNHIVPLQQVAIILRKFRSGIKDSVIIYEQCNSLSRRSRYFTTVMATFTAFSGIANIYVKSCKRGNALVKGIDIQNNKGVMPGTSILENKNELLFINKYLNFKFENMMVDYNYNKTNRNKINQLFNSPSLDLYHDLSIDFVIYDSKTLFDPLVQKNLKLLTTFENYKIYVVPK
jgi:hypothetical protein